MTAEQVQQLDSLNTNGWSWVLMSNVTPCVIRIRLAVDNDAMAGKSIEGSSFEDALSKAQMFVGDTNPDDYISDYYDMLSGE
ncbi:MAG: hypothetical protein KF753_05105 [Caldilineaceae bacterium]|nr:hypothetical protein [Caldilineaceae bacterium]